jgi:hypothetical protein
MVELERDAGAQQFARWRKHAVILRVRENSSGDERGGI